MPYSSTSPLRDGDDDGVRALRGDAVLFVVMSCSFFVVMMSGFFFFLFGGWFLYPANPSCRGSHAFEVEQVCMDNLL